MQGDLSGGYGVALLQTLLALAAVCILAWVVLRWAAQKGLGIGAAGKHVRVIERIGLDARRTLWLVQVGERVILIGAGDGASPTTLAELRAGDLAATGTAAATTPTATLQKTSFADVLRRTRSEAPRSDEPRAVEPRADDDGPRGP